MLRRRILKSVNESEHRRKKEECFINDAAEQILQSAALHKNFNLLCAGEL